MSLVRRHVVPSIALVVAVAGVGIAYLTGRAWIGATLIASLVAGLILVSLDVRARLSAFDRRSSAEQRRARLELTKVRRRARRLQAATGATRGAVTSLRGELRQAERSSREASRKILAAIETERAHAVTRHRDILKQPGVRTAPIKPRSEVPEIAALLQYSSRVPARALLPAPVGFAMNPRSLAHLVDLVERAEPRTVLELGSGASTVWLGYLLERQRGAKVVSIDHLDHYAAVTRAEIDRHGLDSVVDIRVAPLVVPPAEVGDTPWYDASKFDDVDGIDLLVVDGPPQSTGPRARMAAMRVLHERLSPDALVVLDNADRDDEREVLEAWMGDFDLERVDEGVSRLAVLRRRR